MNCFAVKAGDIGARTNTALFHVVEKFAIDGGMRLEDAVIGLGESVLGVFANGDAEYELQKEALRPNGMPGLDHVYQGNTEKGLWKKPITTAKADRGALADTRSFRGDIAPRVFYRLIRDAVWLSGRRHHDDGGYSAGELADAIASILLDGFAAAAPELDGSQPGAANAVM